MLKSDFPNPKLVLPVELINQPGVHNTFGSIESYLDKVAPYIFTDVNLNYEYESSEQNDAWLLRLISENLLRSLYIRNSFVDAMNSKNLASVYLSLKAWLEIVGSLASILDMLESGNSSKEMHKKLEPYVLGNRGQGSLRIGTIEAKGVASMIAKADKYLASLDSASGHPDAKDILKNFCADFYDVASNPTHPSYDAHEMFGKNNGTIWRANTPEEYEKKIIQDRPGYNGLLMSAVFIPDLCLKIFDLKRGDFSNIEAKPYFN